jgi:putative endonuclease
MGATQKHRVKRFYVYMLLCADDSFYVGITSDIELRLGQHQTGWDERCYTFRRRPVHCVHVSDFANFDDAVAWEKHLKGWSRAKKLALIRGDWSEVGRMAKRPSRR